MSRIQYVRIPKTRTIMDPEDPAEPWRPGGAPATRYPFARYVINISNAEVFKSSMEAMAVAMSLISTFRSTEEEQIVAVPSDDLVMLGRASKDVKLLSQLVFVAGQVMSYFDELMKSAKDKLEDFQPPSNGATTPQSEVAPAGN